MFLTKRLPRLPKHTPRVALQSGEAPEVWSLGTPPTAVRDWTLPLSGAIAMGAGSTVETATWKPWNNK